MDLFGKTFLIMLDDYFTTLINGEYGNKKMKSFIWLNFTFIFIKKIQT